MMNINDNQPEQGRSMTEMLGTLAIMGVLSAGAIGGYSYAMNKHRTNELIYEATKRAQWVGTQLEMNNPNPSLNTFGTDSFGFGSFSGIDNNLPNANQFGIQVSDLNKSVCDNLVNHLERTGVVRDVTNVDCNAGTATLVFNRDLSTSDSEITPDEPEVSGEVSGQASTEAPTSQDPDEVHCSGNGSWNGSSCYCDPDWGGDDCAINTSCSGHGIWDQSRNNDAGGCDCNSGWGGSDCSQGARAACNNNGTWYVCGCSCDSGWCGSDCSEDHTCSGHGTWRGDYCRCENGWGGLYCEQDKRNACGDHGVWIFVTAGHPGACSCETGWGGTDCSIQNPCNENSWHGRWSYSLNNYAGGCSCYDNWSGSDCSEEVCSGHGTWKYNNGVGGCSCYAGWCGSDCSTCSRSDCSEELESESTETVEELESESTETVEELESESTETVYESTRP